MFQKKLMLIVQCGCGRTVGGAPAFRWRRPRAGQQAPADGQRRGGRGRGGEARVGTVRPRLEVMVKDAGKAPDVAMPAAAQLAAAPAPMAIKQVKPGVYMVTNDGGNSTVRVTDQGIILVDTKNLGDSSTTNSWRRSKPSRPQPVKYAIVTHVHQDHAGNIERFEKAGVPGHRLRRIEQKPACRRSERKGLRSRPGQTC